MKLYIREVDIPEYAKNFNKGLSHEDIKFYSQTHFNRDRSDNRLNMHCHLIVSRKDQSNKVKISPLTNHRKTKKGAIKGGFDRVTLFENAEKGFDKLFGYNRQLSETFEYCNTMKNGSISEQLNMQEQQIADERKMNEYSQVGIYADKQEGLSESLVENKQDNNTSNLDEDKLNVNLEDKQFFNLPDLGLSSALGLLTPDIGNTEDEQIPKKKKIKKKPKRGFRR